MRAVAIALCLMALPVAGLAAPTWQLITADSGRRIELDRTTIKREDGGKVTALGRVTLDKEISDSRSGQSYRLIESLTRYDCTARNAATLKRTLKKSDDTVVREEEFPGTDMPVRTGTLDDKILREVCRPGGPKFEAQEVLEKANDAAGKLRAANEALVKQTLAKEKAAPQSRAATSPTARLVTRPGGATRPRDEPHAPRVEWAYEGPGAPEQWARIDPANG
ncbi:MAG TPA: carbonic anhydrase family protein, partial [Rhodocyclaceae bacterium]|nr:carbonic anhydrase family protein [Rhodocyclaceae bacterium]